MYLYDVCMYVCMYACMNYTFKKSIPSKWRYFRFRDQRVLADIWTSIDSGFSSKADIGALEIFEHFFQCLQYYLSIETKARWKIDR